MGNSPYRVGIVGATWIAVRPIVSPPAPFRNDIGNAIGGVSHAATLSMLTNTELVAVCDLVPGLLEDFKAAWADDLPDVNTYTDYREMLAREDLDILAVATSDNRHTDIVVDGANAGVKGVLCEKPLATSLEDADRMIEACRERGIPLHVDHNRRWSPLIHRVRDELRAGAIGPLGSVIVSHGGPRAMLFRSGTHMIDAVCFLVESEPAQIFGVLEEGFEDWDRYRGDGGRLPENDPSASGMILFKNGVRVLYDGSKKTILASDSILLRGPKGEIRFNLDARGTAVVSTYDEDTRVPMTRPLHPAHYQIQGLPATYAELIDVIENGGAAVSTAVEARKTLQIMLGFLKSQQEGNRLVDVPS